MKPARPMVLATGILVGLLCLLATSAVPPQLGTPDKSDSGSSLPATATACAVDQRCEPDALPPASLNMGEPPLGSGPNVPTLAPPQNALTATSLPDDFLPPRGQVIYVHVEAEANGSANSE